MKYSENYITFRKEIIKGWNTWNTKSVLSHVLLPESLAINICVLKNSSIKNINEKTYLKDAYLQVYKKRKYYPTIKLGNRTYDGEYVDLSIKWYDLEFRVQSATIDKDLLLLITPINIPNNNFQLIIEVELLWDKPGNILKKDNQIMASLPERSIKIETTASIEDVKIPLDKTYLATRFTRKIGIYTGKERTLDNIKEIIEHKQKKREDIAANYKDLANVYNAVQGVISWDTIYDYENDRVITPVSRFWAGFLWGGYVLFPWDTYFASLMFSMENKELAYLNAIEITKEITEEGFIPNVNAAVGKSYDRSQPPVGSFAILKIYQRYKEKWLLEELYEDLLTWNRWWPKNRLNNECLSWGSNPVENPPGAFWGEKTFTKEGALYESGLDNSPMYDEAIFNEEKHILELADVGLTSLYILDCESVAEIASILGKEGDVKELSERANKYKKSLQKLWDEDTGIFLNYHTDSSTKSMRLSPTLFFPLIVKVPSHEQAKRMINEHFFNESEFNGDWILPSIARNDIAYKDQEYWRGRIWAPFNFLVYLGLLNYDLPKARKQLVEKSKKLLLTEYLEEGHVHENYNANTGDGDDSRISDCFYSWGGLLGFISLIEAGYFKEIG